MTAISVTGLSKSYGDTLAVDGIAFAVAPGETLGLLGGKDRKSTRLNSSHR